MDMFYVFLSSTIINKNTIQQIIVKTQQLCKHKMQILLKFHICFSFTVSFCRKCNCQRANRNHQGCKGHNLMRIHNSMKKKIRQSDTFLPQTFSTVAKNFNKSTFATDCELPTRFVLIAPAIFASNVARSIGVSFAAQSAASA